MRYYEVHAIVLIALICSSTPHKCHIDEALKHIHPDTVFFIEGIRKPADYKKRYLSSEGVSE